jgi:hypothetical protein
MDGHNYEKKNNKHSTKLLIILVKQNLSLANKHVQSLLFPGVKGQEDRNSLKIITFNLFQKRNENETVCSEPFYSGIAIK